MNFDFSQVVAPFRMQPGLRRLEAGARHLTRLTPGPLMNEKRHVVVAGAARQVVAGFDAAPALRAIAAQARLEGHVLSAQDETLPEMAWEQDFAVLDAATGTIPWLAVCIPSHWAPEDKVGLDFTSLHAPVADSAMLMAASAQLVQLVTAGQSWERGVWTISPSSRYDQHPRRHPREAWPAIQDPKAFAGGCWMRWERQTFFPVGQGTRQAVFTITVCLAPLALLVDDAAKAVRLRDALATMSDAVLDYKGLTLARTPLLQWLAQKAGGK